MEKKLEDILYDLEDYKICYCCKSYNLFDNDTCHNCQGSDFIENLEDMEKRINGEYEKYERSGYNEYEINKIKIKVC